MASAEVVDAIGGSSLSAGGTESRRRRLSSDIKGGEFIQKALIRLRPLLLLMRIVDAIKQRWDAKRLGLIAGPDPEANLIKHEAYLKRLVEEVLAKGNLQEVISECDELFREYKDRMLKISSVEEFLQDMGMLDYVVQAAGLPTDSPTSQAVEQYILSHFQV